MGVYPEPALCADDVCRLVPAESRVTGSTAGATLRQTVSTRLRKDRLGGRPRLIVTTLLAAAALGTASAEAARAGLDTAPTAIEIRSDLRSQEIPAEWGDEPLLDRGTAAAIVETGASDPAKPKSASGRDVLRFGDKSVPRPLVETIVKASEATGVDPVYMMALADKESTFDTDVRNPASTAQGLYQFISGTWLEMIRTYGPKHGLAAEAASASKASGSEERKRVLALRNDPYIAGLMAGELIKRDRAKIEVRIGRTMKTSELYLAHFLGTASAGKFLSLSEAQPDTVATNEFREAARSNRTLFKGNGRALTVAEVHEKLGGMIEKRISQYEPVKGLAASQPAEPITIDGPLLDARLRVKDPAIPVLR